MNKGIIYEVWKLKIMYVYNEGFFYVWSYYIDVDIIIYKVKFYEYLMILCIIYL